MTASTSSIGTMERALPGWPGWPPARFPDGAFLRRRLIHGGSDDGGLEEFEEFREELHAATRKALDKRDPLR